MRKIFSVCLILFLVISFIGQSAEAKRFGGGKSFGTYRSSATRSARPATPPNASPASNMSKWLAPLTGIALGGLIASLFMGGHGLGTGILSWVLLAGAIFFIWQFIRKRSQPTLQAPAYPRSENISYHAAAPLNAIHSSHPAGFNADQFLRQAKTQFLRLQAAYDDKNLDDLREFTAPEVFAEIQLQLQERGNTPNQTEVISLNAELLDTEETLNALNASVHFTGSIQEEAEEAPISLSEVWHFTQNRNESTWKVNGIQQN